jgi:hypothetical protein
MHRSQAVQDVRSAGEPGVCVWKHCLPLRQHAIRKISTSYERNQERSRFGTVFVFFDEKNDGQIPLWKPRARRRTAGPPRTQRLVFFVGDRLFPGPDYRRKGSGRCSNASSASMFVV